MRVLVSIEVGRDNSRVPDSLDLGMKLSLDVLNLDAAGDQLHCKLADAAGKEPIIT
jgi:hypothetical protein